ncbi:MAG: AbrB/MazE/SpoVT family DNA-binding domain-containing protein [Nitrososphaeraceae archaeon]
MLPLPREVVDKFNIEAGDIFFFFDEPDGSLRLVRPKV